MRPLLNVFLFGNEVHCGQLLKFAPTVDGVLHIGSNIKHKKVRVAETNNKRSTQGVLRTFCTWATSKAGAQTISKDTASKVRCGHDPAKTPAYDRVA